MYSAGPSRAGDQFHYLWAARKCLKLIDNKSGLKAVVVEGVSAIEKDEDDSASSSPLPSEEKIDVAEYYGSERITDASRITYSQLKHSTRQPDVSFTASGIKPTLRGYAKRFIAIAKRIGYAETCAKIRFAFITNRPISPKVISVVAKCRDTPSSLTDRDKTLLKTLSGLPSCVTGDFFRIVELIGNVNDIWDQQAELRLETSHFLPDADHDVPVQLKDLIATRAAEDLENRRSITKADVFKRLGTDEKLLLPAPNSLQLPATFIERQSFGVALEEIRSSAAAKCIVHAGGGLGKSTFAAFAMERSPEDTRVVLYDCFGNGDYRNPRLVRHKTAVALVQLSNELAYRELCYPLVPSSKATKERYYQAFHYRLDLAIRTHRKTFSAGSLWVIIDAADNAQMAALEFGDGNSFAADLMLETPPEGVKFIFLCRTERRDKLSPPAGIQQIKLKGFSDSETKAHIRNFFPDASSEDVTELHRLSSGDPRVQATALSEDGTLQEILRRLGPTPKSANDMLANLLERKIADLLNKHAEVERKQVENICISLAILRPRVPTDVVARMAEVSESTVRSFVSDLGRPLLTVGDAVQFIDEPAESWFRERFKPTPAEFRVYYHRLRRFESESAYISTCLPQLALEAGLYDELVELGLSKDNIYGSSDFEKKEIALARQIFALKACLRDKKWQEAAKLGFLAAITSAGNERREYLIRNNPDIASIALNTEQLEEIAYRRFSDTGWQGSHNVYEASLLSGKDDMTGEARSRLRMAYEWLDSALKSQRDDDHKERVSTEDIAELAWAHLNISSVQKCYQSLTEWRPRKVTFDVSRLVIARLLEHNRHEDFEKFCQLAVDDFCVALAIFVEMHRFGLTPPLKLISSFSKLLTSKHLNLNEYGRNDYDEIVIDVVTCTVEGAVLSGSLTRQEGAILIGRHLPNKNKYRISEDFDSSRDRLLRTRVLHATLLGIDIEMHELAEEAVAKELQDSKGNHYSSDTRKFKHRIGTLLPWHILRTKLLLGDMPESEFDDELLKTIEYSDKAQRLEYGEHVSYTKSEVAVLRFEIDLAVRKTFDRDHDVFWGWLSADFKGVRPSVLSRIIRIASQHKEYVPFLRKMLFRAVKFSKRANEQAEVVVDEFIELARSALAYSRDESIAIFDVALETANLLGEENVPRWESISLLGSACEDADAHDPRLAHKFGRVGELTWYHVARNKHFPWEHSVRALVGISPAAAFSVFARWSDRKFGRRTRVIGVALQEAMRLGLLSTDEVMVFQSMQAATSIEKVMSGYRKGESLDVERSLKYPCRYLDMWDRSSSSWQSLLSVAKENQVSASLQNLLEEKLDDSSKRDDIRSENTHGDRVPSDAHVWEYHCRGLSFRKTSDIKVLRDKAKGSSLERGFEVLFDNCVSRVRSGDEVKFINAIGQYDGVGLYSKADWLLKLSQIWSSSIAVRRALNVNAKHIAAESGAELYRPIYCRKDAPSTKLAMAGNCEESDIFACALEARSETIDGATSGQLFSTVGMLSGMLSSSQARDVLHFALDSISENIPEDLGDGCWNAKFDISSDPRKAIAGYAWQALCDAQASDRWFASHLVRGLLELGIDEVLKAIIELDREPEKGEAYFNQSFVPYLFSGRLHLTIGLARGALTNEAAPEFVIDYLKKVAFQAEPHVLIRQISAFALSKISSEKSEEFQAALLKLNSPKKPVEKAVSYERKRKTRARATSRQLEDTKFLLDYEMRKDVERLGDVFALSEVEIEKTIQTLWGTSYTGRYDEDARGKADLYREQRSGNADVLDTLSQYIGYHGMMITAGKLLETGVVGQNPDGNQNDFDNWMEYRALGRKNGLWKSDVRTCRPASLADFGHQDIEKEHWKWSVLSDDLLNAFTDSSQNFVLWGSWTQVSGDRIQRTRVHSALVDADLASSLATSLQLQSELSGFSIPTELRNHSSIYQLGAISEWSGSMEGIDDSDPWATDLGTHLPELSSEICKKLSLKFNEETQSWYRELGENEEIAAKRQVWTHPQDYDREGNSGQRIVVDPSFLKLLVGDESRSLIFEVSVNREFPSSGYSTIDENDNEISYPKPYVRYFTFEATGKIRAF